MQAAHKYLTAEVLARLPKLYSQEKVKDPIAQVKYFTPDSSWTWYATEYNPTDKLFFGKVVGQETELGYFSLDDIMTGRGPLGLKIERDLYFDPKPLSECN